MAGTEGTVAVDKANHGASVGTAGGVSQATDCAVPTTIPFDRYVFTDRKTGLRPVDGAAPARKNLPSHPKRIEDQTYEWHYDRLTNLIHILPEQDHHLIVDPQEDFAVNPVLALTNTCRIVAKLGHQVHHYRKLGRERYALFQNGHFARILRAYCAEQMTASWMEREIMRRAGLEL